MRALAEYGIQSGRIEGLSGVWVGEEKIAAIGVKMGRVTSHGFALNVTTDLTYFGYLIPCGIRDKGVTSMLGQLQLVGSPTDGLTLERLVGPITHHFGEVFGRRMVETSCIAAGRYQPAAAVTL